jgi:hypothetical protein
MSGALSEAPARAGSRSEPRSLEELATRGCARVDAGRRAGHARWRRNLRHESRRGRTDDGYGLRRRPARRQDPAGGTSGAAHSRARRNGYGCHTNHRRRVPCAAFIDADTEFHRVIVFASGNATLASVIQNLSGGMARARLWRTITEHDAVEITKQRHRDIYVALRAGDAEEASAADLIHLADGERWLQRWLARALAAGDVGQPQAPELNGKSDRVVRPARGAS